MVLTLSISIERYCSVCHSTCQFRAKSLLLPVPVVFAVIYNIPKFFELKTEIDFETYCETNISNNQENKTISSSNCYNETNTYIGVTDLRRNPLYIIIYLFWSKFVFVELVPYVLMIVMNILIWRKIQEFARIRRTALGINDGKLF